MTKRSIRPGQSRSGTSGIAQSNFAVGRGTKGFLKQRARSDRLFNLFFYTKATQESVCGSKKRKSDGWEFLFSHGNTSLCKRGFSVLLPSSWPDVADSDGLCSLRLSSVASHQHNRKSIFIHGYKAGFRNVLHPFYVEHKYPKSLSALCMTQDVDALLFFKS